MRAYAHDIDLARAQKDHKKVSDLQSDCRFEIDMLDEEADCYSTNQLLTRARRLRVPIPMMYEDNKTLSCYWQEGRYTGDRYLTTAGFTVLRQEIRNELKAKHEDRSRWVVWISALTGLIGSITGLVATLRH